MEQSITELTKTTAQNIHDLLMQLASHIDQLQQENADLKDKLKSLEAQ